MTMTWIWKCMTYDCNNRLMRKLKHGFPPPPPVPPDLFICSASCSVRHPVQQFAAIYLFYQGKYVEHIEQGVLTAKTTNNDEPNWQQKNSCYSPTLMRGKIISFIQALPSFVSLPVRFSLSLSLPLSASLYRCVSVSVLSSNPEKQQQRDCTNRRECDALKMVMTIKNVPQMPVLLQNNNIHKLQNICQQTESVCLLTISR